MVYLQICVSSCLVNLKKILAFNSGKYPIKDDHKGIVVFKKNSTNLTELWLFEVSRTFYPFNLLQFLITNHFF